MRYPMTENLFAFYLLIFLLGSLLGALLFWFYHHFALGGVKRLGADILFRAEQESEELRKGAELGLKQKQLEQQKELDQLWQLERKKIQREEDRVRRATGRQAGKPDRHVKRNCPILRRERQFSLGAKFNWMKRRKER